MNWNSIVSGLKSFGSAAGMTLKNYTPEILVGVGAVGATTAAVIACKQTLKAPAILEEHRANIDSIKDAKEIADQFGGVVECTDEETGEVKSVEYTQKDYKKDLSIQYWNTTKEFIKLYWKPVLLGVASFGAIGAGTGMLRMRWAGSMAAYAALDASDKMLKENIIKKYGKEELTKLQHGLIEKEVEVEETDENGKTKKVKKKVLTGEKPQQYTDYSRLFDCSNPNWNHSQDNNMAWLNGMEHYFNDLLAVKKVLSLNEVYDALGFEPVKEGVQTGWTFGRDANPDGDGYVQLTVVPIHYDDEEERNYSPRNPRLLIDFNVDGNIFANYKSKKEADRPIQEVVYAN